MIHDMTYGTYDLIIDTIQGVFISITMTLALRDRKS